MKYLLFLLFFAASPLAQARMAAPMNLRQETQAPILSKKQGKLGLFYRLLEKQIVKHFKKACATPKGDGRGWVTAWVYIFVLNVLLFLIVPLWGLVAVLPLGLAGLICSIVGLVKVAEFDNDRRQKRLAILGIILNYFALMFGIVVWVFLFM